MHTTNSTPENSIASTNTDVNHRITGPHYEPPTVSNATTYWRCEFCYRESTREQDLYRQTFHADNCEVAAQC